MRKCSRVETPVGWVHWVLKLFCELQPILFTFCTFNVRKSSFGPRFAYANLRCEIRAFSPFVIGRCTLGCGPRFIYFSVRPFRGRKIRRRPHVADSKGKDRDLVLGFNSINNFENAGSLDTFPRPFSKRTSLEALQKMDVQLPPSP